MSSSTTRITNQYLPCPPGVYTRAPASTKRNVADWRMFMERFRRMDKQSKGDDALIYYPFSARLYGSYESIYVTYYETFNGKEHKLRINQHDIVNFGNGYYNIVEDTADTIFNTVIASDNVSLLNTYTESTGVVNPVLNTDKQIAFRVYTSTKQRQSINYNRLRHFGDWLRDDLKPIEFEHDINTVKEGNILTFNANEKHLIKAKLYSNKNMEMSYVKSGHRHKEFASYEYSNIMDNYFYYIHPDGNIKFTPYLHDFWNIDCVYPISNYHQRGLMRAVKWKDNPKKWGISHLNLNGLKLRLWSGVLNVRLLNSTDENSRPKFELQLLDPRQNVNGSLYAVMNIGIINERYSEWDGKYVTGIRSYVTGRSSSRQYHCYKYNVNANFDTANNETLHHNLHRFFPYYPAKQPHHDGRYLSSMSEKELAYTRLNNRNYTEIDTSPITTEDGGLKEDDVLMFPVLKRGTYIGTDSRMDQREFLMGDMRLQIPTEEQIEEYKTKGFNRLTLYVPNENRHTTKYPFPRLTATVLGPTLSKYASGFMHMNHYVQLWDLPRHDTDNYTVGINPRAKPFGLDIEYNFNGWDQSGYYYSAHESCNLMISTLNLASNYFDGTSQRYYRMHEMPFYGLYYYDIYLNDTGLTPVTNGNYSNIKSMITVSRNEDYRPKNQTWYKASNEMLGQFDVKEPMYLNYNNIVIDLQVGDFFYAESIYPTHLRGDYPYPSKQYRQTKPYISHPRIGYYEDYYYCIQKPNVKSPSDRFEPIIPINDGRIEQGVVKGPVLLYRDNKYYFIKPDTQLIEIENRHLPGVTFWQVPEGYTVNEAQEFKSLLSLTIRRLKRHHIPLRAKAIIEYNDEGGLTNSTTPTLIDHDATLSRLYLLYDNEYYQTGTNVDDLFTIPVNELTWDNNYYPFKEVRGEEGLNLDKIEITNSFRIHATTALVNVIIHEPIVVDLPIDLDKIVNNPEYDGKIEFKADQFSDVIDSGTKNYTRYTRETNWATLGYTSEKGWYRLSGDNNRGNRGTLMKQFHGVNFIYLPEFIQRKPEKVYFDDVILIPVNMAASVSFNTKAKTFTVTGLVMDQYARVVKEGVYHMREIAHEIPEKYVTGKSIILNKLVKPLPNSASGDIEAYRKLNFTYNFATNDAWVIKNGEDDYTFSWSMNKYIDRDIWDDYSVVDDLNHERKSSQRSLGHRTDSCAEGKNYTYYPQETMLVNEALGVYHIPYGESLRYSRTYSYTPPSTVSNNPEYIKNINDGVYVSKTHVANISYRNFPLVVESDYCIAPPVSIYTAWGYGPYIDLRGQIHLRNRFMDEIGNHLIRLGLIRKDRFYIAVPYNNGRILNNDYLTINEDKCPIWVGTDTAHIIKDAWQSTMYDHNRSRGDMKHGYQRCIVYTFDELKDQQAVDNPDIKYTDMPYSLHWNYVDYRNGWVRSTWAYGELTMPALISTFGFPTKLGFSTYLGPGYFPMFVPEKAQVLLAKNRRTVIMNIDDKHAASQFTGEPPNNFSFINARLYYSDITRDATLTTMQERFPDVELNDRFKTYLLRNNPFHFYIPYDGYWQPLSVNDKDAWLTRLPAGHVFEDTAKRRFFHDAFLPLPLDTLNDTTDRYTYSLDTQADFNKTKVRDKFYFYWLFKSRLYNVNGFVPIGYHLGDIATMGISFSHYAPSVKRVMARDAGGPMSSIEFTAVQNPDANRLYYGSDEIKHAVKLAALPIALAKHRGTTARIDYQNTFWFSLQVNKQYRFENMLDDSLRILDNETQAPITINYDPRFEASETFIANIPLYHQVIRG